MKKSDSNCSARNFAQKAGFTNPGFLNDVIKGRRTISKGSRQKLIDVFKLTESEADYFNVLVEYGQSKKAPIRQELYKQLISRRNHSAFVKLHPALSKYYQDFRYPLIYNALMACDFRGDYEMLSNFLFPSIPASQLKTYVDDLCNWGLVIRQESGRYTVTQRFIEPSVTLMEQVRQLNREWILQATEALMKLPADKRHVSTMLLSASPAACKTIAQRIEDFRQEMWRIVQDDIEEPSCIMQLNIQYFPRSKARNHDENAQ